MLRTIIRLCVVLLLIACAVPMPAQQPAAVASSSTAVVPPLVSFSGVLSDVNGKPLTGVVGVTFALYTNEQGGAPLWLETQNVYPDKTGHYTVLLGATTSTGLPADLFAAGEARWLGVEVQGQGEQVRVSLASVPYSLKAGDAQTVGGLPASAFVLAVPAAGGGAESGTPGATNLSSDALSAHPMAATSGSGTTNYVPLWTNSSTLGDSMLYQSGSNVGVGTSSPLAPLHLVSAIPHTMFLDLYNGVLTGAPMVFRSARGTPSHPSAVQAGDVLGGFAVRGYGSNNFSGGGSGQMLFKASENWTNSANGTSLAFAVTPSGTTNTTQVMTITGAGSVGIGTTAPVANLEVNGTSKFDGLVTFAAGQTVTGNLTTTGAVAAGSFNIGGKPFGSGSYANQDAFLGFAGNTTSTGTNNTGVGYLALSANTTGNYNMASGADALYSNSTGSANTASGYQALQSNTTGYDNTANGAYALQSNTTGTVNTASGMQALWLNTASENTAYGAFALELNTTGNSNTAIGTSSLLDNKTGNGNSAIGYQSVLSNTTGSYNTALGYSAGPDSTTPALTNSTAIGAYADVAQSNAVVLGCTSGVNGCPAPVNVGIGTTSPAYMLDVRGTGNFTGLINFASGQTFPGTALLNSANTFTGNQTVNGNLSATGVVTGSSFQIGSNLFAFGSYFSSNAFLGFAGNTTTTGGANTASGVMALAAVTSGGFNTASGYQALYSNTTGSSNTALGSNALQNNTAGGQNTATGDNALYSNTTGNDNTANGILALFLNTTGSDNTASGYDALYSNTTASGNTATGTSALFSNTLGSGNTADGNSALYQNVGDAIGDGWSNTAVGAQALYSNNASSGSGTAACCNTAVGEAALMSSTTGSYNTATGSLALDNSTGSYNTAAGSYALNNNTTGAYNTAVGFGADVGSGTFTNATAIGAYAVAGASNALILGGTGTYAVAVGIGTGIPTNVLTIVQGGGSAIADGWTTYSSRRWKTNIHTLNGALGKVEQLRGVSYDLKDSGKHEVGVIAEEVGAVVPELVSYEKNGTDARSVDYGRLTALLIEAVKQQQQEISVLQTQLRKRAAKEATLDSRLKRLEQGSGQTQLASARPVR